MCINTFLNVWYCFIECCLIVINNIINSSARISKRKLAILILFMHHQAVSWNVHCKFKYHDVFDKSDPLSLPWGGICFWFLSWDGTIEWKIGEDKRNWNETDHEPQRSRTTWCNDGFDHDVYSPDLLSIWSVKIHFNNHLFLFWQNLCEQNNFS